MKVNRSILLAPVLGLVLLSACSSRDDDAGTTAGTTALSPAETEGILRAASLTEQDVDIPEDPDFTDETGLDTASFEYCDEPAAADEQRVARAEQWWKSPEALGGAGRSDMVGGKLIVGNEIVAYRGAGAEDVLAAFVELPESCPKHEYGDELQTFLTHESVAPPPDLPAGSVAVRADITYRSNGFRLQGRYVAIPQGDVVAVLTVWADTSFDIDELTARLADLLAERTSQLSTFQP